VRTLLAILVISFGATAMSCGAENAVDMVPGRHFDPSSVEVHVGETVTWENQSDDAHTVTAEEASLPDGAGFFASGDFSSERAAHDDLAGGLLQNGDTFEVTFDVPGTYRYYCIPHRADGMRGVIVVEE
jgi:plastocyanin